MIDLTRCYMTPEAKANLDYQHAKANKIRAELGLRPLKKWEAIDLAIQSLNPKVLVQHEK